MTVVYNKASHATCVHGHRWWPWRYNQLKSLICQKSRAGELIVISCTCDHDTLQVKFVFAPTEQGLTLGENNMYWDSRPSKELPHSHSHRLCESLELARRGSERVETHSGMSLWCHHCMTRARWEYTLMAFWIHFFSPQECSYWSVMTQ